jgi:hypothetical protein
MEDVCILHLRDADANADTCTKINMDETAMEVDETEDEIRPKEVNDYGIDVNFSDLEEDDQEVCFVVTTFYSLLWTYLSGRFS